MELSGELLKYLKEDSAFKVFQGYILEKIDELDTVIGLEDKTNEQAGEMVKVRFLAIKLLKEILDPVMDFREKYDPSVKDIQRKKDKFGL